MKTITIALLLLAATAAHAASPPETVLAYFYPKPGKEAQLEKILGDYWTTLARLDLVDAPRVTLRGSDAKGRVYYVVVQTWKSVDIPDNAPPEIVKIWDAMNAVVESRDGKAGIHFDEVTVIP
ncbi:MAG TPA: hypothetical protein VN181_15840 [Thermoanaerobaculia bacterium]|nr:hypothetical protein [Thermoanaerobaculia bacterium]